MTTDPFVLMTLIQQCLTPDLLRKGYGGQHPLQGHCYVATEALRHFLDDPQWKPKCGKDDLGITHWWLENQEGYILDPTAEQYLDQDSFPPYNNGVKKGFLTKQPSKRCAILMQRVTHLFQQRRVL